MTGVDVDLPVGGAAAPAPRRDAAVPAAAITVPPTDATAL
jgi:multiple sugar transport system permease protein